MRLPHVIATEPTRGTTDARLYGGWLLAARTGWLILALASVGLFLAALPARLAQLRDSAAAMQAVLAERGLSLDTYVGYQLGMDVVNAAVFCGVGALIFWRKSNERLALFVASMLVTFGTQSNTDVLLAALPAWRLAITLLGAFGWTSLGLFLYIFPNGHFVPAWTRAWALVWVLLQLPGALFPDWPLIGPTPVGLALQLAIWASVIYAQIYRYRRVSSSTERQQTKWLVFSVTSTLGLALLFSGVAAVLPDASPSDSLALLLLDPLTKLALLPIPLALGVAVLRYRLWDIDPIINRTLVYAGLTTAVVGIYVVLVGYLGAVFRTSGNLLISLIATGVVAVLFQPLRDRLQRGVNRLMYGERDEPYAVLTRLGQRLEGTLAPEAILPTIVATVQESLRLPYAAIALVNDDTRTIAAAVGTAMDEAVRFPLIYQQETVGELVLAPRAPGETFSAVDRRLLDALARQAGVAVHAIQLTAQLQRLTADLQRSREQLVTAREEERLRLRRDLHDGLGPALAGFTLSVGAARNLLARDPATADRLLIQLGGEIEAAVGDIKRLVYNLRPPALDELGLLGAIRARATHDTTTQAAGGVQIDVEAPAQLPALPAAVEVAAYRIVQEGLTNVLRHAQAHRCVVRLCCDSMLNVEIVDDGVGLRPAGRPVQAGVGLRSMRERAAELGGRCVIEPAATGGTCVRAWLPIGSHAPSGAEKE
jgi:signal transduction histidine kinase